MRRIFLVLAMFAAACSDDDPEPQVPTHPEGVLGPRLTLADRPFGVAVSRDSVILATQLDAAAMGRGRTNLNTFSGSVAVGSVPTSVAIAPSGVAYVANQFSGDVGVVPAGANAQTGSVAVPGDPFYVTVSSDSRTVYVSSNIDSVFVINTATSAITARIAVGADPNGLALSPNGSRLYVTNMSSGNLSDVDLGTSTVSRTITLGGVPQGVVASPDGNEIYVANEGGLLQVINVGTGNVTTGGAGTGSLFGLALSPDGEVLIGTRPSAGEVVLINRATRQVRTTVTTGGAPRRVALDLMGTMAVVANETGWVDLIR